MSGDTSHEDLIRAINMAKEAAELAQAAARNAEAQAAMLQTKLDNSLAADRDRRPERRVSYMDDNRLNGEIKTEEEEERDREQNILDLQVAIRMGKELGEDVAELEKELQQLCLFSKPELEARRAKEALEAAKLEKFREVNQRIEEQTANGSKVQSYYQMRNDTQNKLWYLQFDGQDLARIIELSEGKEPKLMVTGLDDNEMISYKVALSEAPLLEKMGKEIREVDFFNHWVRLGERQMMKPPIRMKF